MGLIFTNGLNCVTDYGYQFKIPCCTSKSDYSALFQDFGESLKSIEYVDKNGNSRCFPVISGGYKDSALPFNVFFNNKHYYAVELHPQLVIFGNMTGQGVTDSQSGTTTVNITNISTKEYWTGKSGIKINTPIEVRIQGMYRTSVRVNSSIYTFPANTTSVSSSSLRNVGIATAYTIRIAVHNTETDTWFYSTSVTRAKTWSKTIDLQSF